MNDTVSSAPTADPALDWSLATLISVVETWADRRPDATVYSWLDDGETVSRTITFAGLRQEARTVGAALARFVKPGERVLLLYGDGPDYVIGLLGCLYAGAVPVSGVHPGTLRAFERFVGVVRDCGARGVIGPAAVLAEMQQIDEDAVDDLGLTWIASDRLPAPRPGPAPALAGLDGRNGDLAFIQYTSGSTRAPRGVALTHRNILHNLDSQAEAFGYRVGSTGVSWLPFSHDMGLIGAVLMALKAGGHCVMFAPSRFLRRPERWLKAIARFGATVSGGPNFAYDLCARRVPPALVAGLDLSAWTLAFNGAEPVRKAVLDRFAAFAAPAGFKPEALYPCYGLAESTLFVTGGDPGAPVESVRLDRAALAGGRAVPAADDAAPDAVATLVGCGRARGGQRLEIVEPESGAALPEGAVGEIWIAGGSVAAGYFGRGAENEAVFGGRLADGSGPFLRTGDLGFRLGGEVYVTGRLRDLIILRGRNHYPQDIEATAEEAHPAVRAGGTAAFMTADEDEPGLAVVCEIGLDVDPEGRPAIAAAVAAAIAAGHGIAPDRIVLLPPGGVLKTPSGKVQRAQTRAAVEEGSVELLATYGA